MVVAVLIGLAVLAFIAGERRLGSPKQEADIAAARDAAKRADKWSGTG